jgi:hypothetical protein
MLICMRTTLNLNDALMRQAKKAAADAGTSVTAVIEAALRDYLRPKAGPRSPQPSLPVSRCRGGLQPGIQLNNTSELLHELEVEDANL